MCSPGHYFPIILFLWIISVHSLCWCSVCIQVTSFIREESRENMQIIVISLKEEFFSKADALLGVYSDVTKL